MTSEEFDFGSDLPSFGADQSSALPDFAIDVETPAAKTLTQPTSPAPVRTSVPKPVAVATSPAPIFEAAAAPVAEKRRRGFGWLFAVPAWLISLALHTSLLLAMAAYNIEPISDALKKLVIDSGPVEDVSALESFDVTSESLSTSDLSEQTEMVQQNMPTMDRVVTDVPLEVAAVSLDVGVLSDLSLESLSSQLVPSNVLSASANTFTQAMTGRSSASKRDLLEKYGGGSDTEKAVAMGLKWLAAHQQKDGSWTFATAANSDVPGDTRLGNFPDARNAATGLALMAFLGAGQTHQDGEFKANVFGGLSYLLSNMRTSKFGGVPIGSWYDDPDPKGNGRNKSEHNRMYGQGIATTAMCEAFGMTNDAKLAEAAQLGVNFIVAAQDPRGGGWNYRVRSPGDTSIVGWQMMALKSGMMSNIQFPVDTIRRASYFLDTVQTDGGSAYHYRVPGDKPGNMALTSCGLLCRMYMGMPKEHPAIVKGAADVLKAGPSSSDSYVNYYATQVMKQVGGETWKKWNEQMKNQLVTTQVNSGKSMGSWPADGKLSYGDNEGGTLYRTAMSIMILEVYYRYLPIYHEQADEEAFKL